jgi:predicted DNA-binding transcriptional regulator YafY
MRQTNDTLLRYLQLLQLLPVVPNKKSTTQLRSELSQLDQAYAVSARTTQRDLEKLSLIFPITNEQVGRSYYWYWADQTSYAQFPAMGKAQALALILADKYLDKVLPPDVHNLLSAYIAKASSILAESDLSDVEEKIIRIESGPALIHKKIDIEVRQQVFDAVLQEKQLTLHYKNQVGTKKVFEHLHPLGIVIKDNVSYLVAFTMPNKYKMQFALHRIKKALISTDNAHKDNKYTLQSYIFEESEFSYPITHDEIKLKLRIDSSLVSYFQENSLSSNQKVKQVDGKWLVNVTTGDNADLRWWLLSFGDKVEVISPASLRDEFTRLLIDTAGLYLDNRVFTQEDKSTCYTGHFIVEKRAFTLDAISFVVRSGEVAFLLFGEDDQEFKIEGNALLTKDGKYLSGELPINYFNSPSDNCHAHLEFTLVRSGEKACRIEAKWIEGEEEWVFAGILRAIN